jgi:hypothetical protein
VALRQPGDGRHDARGREDGGARSTAPWHVREEIEAPVHGDDWPVPVARRLAEHVALWQLRPRWS